MENTPIQRLRAFFDVKNIRQKDLIGGVSVTKQSISRWFNDAKDISAQHLHEIKSKYSDLNVEWIITGRGEMLINDGSDDYPLIASDNECKYGIECKNCTRLQAQIDLLKMFLKSREAECRQLDYELKRIRPPNDD